MGSDKIVKRVRARRGVTPNVEWLVRQAQVRLWTIADFSNACAASGRRVSPPTINAALHGRRVDKASYEAMCAAIAATPPLIPDEAIA